MDSNILFLKLEQHTILKLQIGNTYPVPETFTVLGTQLGGATNDVPNPINTVNAGAIATVPVNGTANDAADGLEANSGQWETVSHRN